MRKLLIGLSIVFFALAGLVLFKALELSAYQTRYQTAPAHTEPESPSPEVQNTIENLAKEQEAKQALVEELQATISSLEDKLASKNEEVPEPVPVGEPKKEARTLAVLGAGSFNSGQVIINDEVMNTVQELLPEILAYPEYRVAIEGHTDNIPIKAYSSKRYKDNMELSFLRAKAVALVLEKNGIPLDRITVTGYGDTRPIDSNDTDEGRIKNRRVEVRLIPEDKDF